MPAPAPPTEGSVPPFGAPGEYLRKLSLVSYDMEWGDLPPVPPFPEAPTDGALYGRANENWQIIPNELPVAGLPGDVLTKRTAANGDVLWAAPVPPPPPLEFMLPATMVVTGTEVVGSILGPFSFAVADLNLPATGYWWTPLEIYLLRRGGPTPTGTWAAELMHAQRPGSLTWNMFGREQAFSTFFSADVYRILRYLADTSVFTQPACLDPGERPTIDFRLRCVTPPSGAFSLPCGMVGKLYQYLP